MPSPRVGIAIVLTDPGTLPPDRWRDAKVVFTPLDLIVALDGMSPVDVVVLDGSRAIEPAIPSFLRESYPLVEIVAGVTSPHVVRPRAFAAGSQPAIALDTSGDAAGGEHTDSVEPGYS